MRILRWGLALGALALVAAVLYQAQFAHDLWNQRGGVHVGDLGSDEQEIALIEPATNSDDWERLVSAVQSLQRDWRDEPKLHISLEGAFPRLTADVPEIGFWLGGDEGQKLWLRWYKISGEHDTASWIEKLRLRARPPLAVMGGGSSGRAIRLAQAQERTTWPVAAPLLLITTATAEIDARIAGRNVMEIYRGRSFRFAFANSLMVEAVLRFSRQNPQVWVHKHGEPAVLAGAATIGDAWAALAFLHVSGHLAAPMLHTIHWDDDIYSRDLADAFREEFRKSNPGSAIYDEGGLPYSVGDFYHPTPPEQAAVSALLTNRSPFPPHSLLVLPSSAARMRRFLGNLRSRAPLDVRNLLVVNGDSLTFHTLYRDRDYAWNIQDLPFSLIVFAHRNPIDTDAGFGWRGDTRLALSTTGTHDLLLFRDIVESMLNAVFRDGKLLGDTAVVGDRLRQSRWATPPGARSPRVGNALVHDWARDAPPLFDASGNRERHTGEHIVWLRPSYSGDRLDLVSTLSVWQSSSAADEPAWRLVEAREIAYNQSRSDAE